MTEECGSPETSRRIGSPRAYGPIHQVRYDSSRYISPLAMTGVRLGKRRER